MESSKCIMCGLPHTGEYVICDACISEYNLTSEQIEEMGDPRMNEGEATSGDNKTSSDEHLTSIPGVRIKTTTSNAHTTSPDQISEKKYPEQTYTPESYTNVLYHFAKDLDTIKSIMYFYFVITIIGLVIYILTAMASSN